MPSPGGGSNRWHALAETLADCRAVLVSGVGNAPREALRVQGIDVVLTEGLVDDAVLAVVGGRTAPPPRRIYRCREACAGDGNGCG